MRLSPLGIGQDDSPQIQAAVQPNSTIELAPGRFELHSTLYIDLPGVTITGDYDATALVRIHNPNDYQDRVFSTHDGLSATAFKLFQFSVRADPSCPQPPLLYHTNSVGGSFDFGSVTLVGMAGIMAGPPGVVHSCEFHNSGTRATTGQAYQNCIWHGAPAGTQNEMLVQGSGITLVSLEFNGTMRGIKFSNASGVNAYGLRFYDIAGGINAGELLLVEGGFFSDSTIQNVDISGCDGAAIEDWLASMTGVNFSNFEINGSYLLLAGNDSRNTFTNFGMRNCYGIALGPNAQAGNSFNGFGIDGMAFGAENQNAAFAAVNFQPRDFVQNPGTNEFANFGAANLPPGMKLGVAGI